MSTQPTDRSVGSKLAASGWRDDATPSWGPTKSTPQSESSSFAVFLKGRQLREDSEAISGLELSDAEARLIERVLVGEDRLDLLVTELAGPVTEILDAARSLQTKGFVLVDGDQIVATESLLNRMLSS